MKKAIRTQYEEKGVDAFYKAHADVYENPHFPYIKTLLQQNEHRIDYSRVFDFCSGGGEVTLVLSEKYGDNKEECKKRFVGCDPFTFKLYEKNTGCKCFSLNFEDVLKGKWIRSNNRDTPSVQEPFSAIICSFAMHLCPEKLLYPLVTQLFLHAPNIVIITPHKRPELEKLSGVKLLFDDFTLTERGKKVFLKSYVQEGV